MVCNTGGTSPFNYFWNNGSTTSSINGLTAGDYIISITDANGCISSPAADTLTVSEPTILQSSIIITNHATCTGAQTLATGELNVTISGGVPPIILIFWAALQSPKHPLKAVCKVEVESTGTPKTV